MQEAAERMRSSCVTRGAQCTNNTMNFRGCDSGDNTQIKLPKKGTKATLASLTCLYRLWKLDENLKNFTDNKRKAMKFAGYVHTKVLK